MSEGYGYVYNVETGEIDFQDVMLNRRLLIVMLPAMERSPQSLEMLGKITVLSLKAMLGALGSTRPEGLRREILDGNPSKSKVPAMVVLDEVGMYMAPGMAVIPAQARSLGVAMYFGTQAISDLMKASEHEGKGILENTALKMLGRTASPEDGDTARTAIGMGGRARTQVASEARFERGSLPGVDDRLRLGPSSSLQDDATISYEDLVQQQDGEFHAIIGIKETGADGVERGGARTVRMRSFFTGLLTPLETFRRNPYVVVRPPLARARHRPARVRARRPRPRAGLALALEAPSKALVTGVATLERGAAGRFLDWRAAERAAGSWPAGRAERLAAIRAWLEAEDAARDDRLALAKLRADADTTRRALEDAAPALGPGGTTLAHALIAPWQARLEARLRGRDVDTGRGADTGRSADTGRDRAAQGAIPDAADIDAMRGAAHAEAARHLAQLGTGGARG